LLAAGLVEVAFALSIEPTKGFTRPLQTALCFVLGAGSIYLLTHALKTLPIGTAYAVFTGIGAIGTVVLGIGRKRLEGAEVNWISTVRPDGRPHVTPLLSVWLDGALYVCTGPDECKAKNLVRNPHFSLRLGATRSTRASA
jgi:multidrug transporter EmrE-like cation transporter